MQPLLLPCCFFRSNALLLSCSLFFCFSCCCFFCSNALLLSCSLFFCFSCCCFCLPSCFLLCCLPFQLSSSSSLPFSFGLLHCQACCFSSNSKFFLSCSLFCFPCCFFRSNALLLSCSLFFCFSCCCFFCSNALLLSCSLFFCFSCCCFCLPSCFLLCCLPFQLSSSSSLPFSFGLLHCQACCFSSNSKFFLSCSLFCFPCCFFCSNALLLSCSLFFCFSCCCFFGSNALVLSCSLFLGFSCCCFCFLVFLLATRTRIWSNRYDYVTLPAERPGTGNAPPLDCRESAGFWSWWTWFARVHVIGIRTLQIMFSRHKHVININGGPKLPTSKPIPKSNAYHPML